MLGGVFTQSFDYTESKDFGTLNLEDSAAFGYRLGAAYEIKEYALRAELMYRSQVDHDASGLFTLESATLAGVLVLRSEPSSIQPDLALCRNRLSLAAEWYSSGLVGFWLHQVDRLERAPDPRLQHR